MPFGATLPAELWLIILDIVISTRITLLDQCDHTSFPDIHAYLHSTAPRAPFDNSYGQLRLVCRTFDALLGAAPHYIMKSPRDSIPASARAVYIIEDQPSEHVPRLLEQPLICHRLVHLDSFFNHPGLPNMPTTFDLCENSRALPNLHCLTLRLVVFGNAALPSFWAQLNDAFPLLRRLVLIRCGLNLFPILHECHGGVTCRNLELLILDDGIQCVPRLHFPRLRHVALDMFVGFEPEMLARSPLLESIIIDTLNYGTKIDLKAFPRLRLVGVGARDAHAILPAGDDHPLEHLWLTVDEFSFSVAARYIMRVTNLLPGVSQITLDVTMCHETCASVEARLQEADLRSAGLSLYSIPRSDSRIVLKRAQMDPPTSSQPWPAKQHRLLNWIQSNIHR